MAKLAFEDNDFINAKKFGFKAVDQDDLATEKDLIPSYGFIDLCYTFMMSMCSRNESAQGVFWAKLGKKCCKKIIQYYEEHELGIRECEISLAKEQKSTSEHKITIFNIIISQTRVKIFNKNIELIINAFDNENVAAEIKENIKEKNTFLQIKLKNSDYIFLLVKNLWKNNIICSFDNQNEGILIHNPIYINVHALSVALKNWKNEVSTKLEIKMAPDSASQTSFISVQPVVQQVNLPLVAEKPEAKLISEIKISNKEKNKSEDSSIIHEEKTHKKPNKLIDWGKNYPRYEKNSSNNHVFKLYGSTIVRHYLFIKPELYEALNQYPLIVKNLEGICERGKVLNKSKNGKGIVVKGDRVKIKDSSKDYRFYGNVVASTTKDNKTYKLVSINSYTLTHKQKVSNKV
jgi:hypothetical protein